MKYSIFFVIICSSVLLFAINKPKTISDIIIDSKMTLEQALKGKSVPKEILDSLILLDLKYYGFDGKIHQGQMIVHQSVKKDVEDIFALILKEKFPIKKMIPICEYNWDDDASMLDNNTSSFNYRNIAGTNRLSRHAYGMAIDINPFYNPVVHKDGSIVPKGAKYDVKRNGTLYANHFIVKAFKERGWRWGGEFNSYKDYHHFDK